MTDVEPLLSIRDLAVAFRSAAGETRALDGVRLELAEGERLGLVGESGSGKSLTALAILGLLPGGARVASGSIRWRGRELLALSEAELRGVRGREIALVMQDPRAALDPVWSVGDQVAEGLRAHFDLSRADARARAVALLADVGIEPAAVRARHYPHQLSGGMRQRAALAAALACGPRLLIADEPTTALDATLQAQVLELVRAWSERERASVLWITHDLGVVLELCTRAAVMFAGRVVEIAPVRELFLRPRHPYTAALLAALDPRAPAGPPASAAEPGPGCRYRGRCPLADERCAREEPELAEVAPGASAACWRSAEVRRP